MHSLSSHAVLDLRSCHPKNDNSIFHRSLWPVYMIAQTHEQKATFSGSLLTRVSGCNPLQVREDTTKPRISPHLKTFKNWNTPKKILIIFSPCDLHFPSLLFGRCVSQKHATGGSQRYAVPWTGGGNLTHLMPPSLMQYLMFIDVPFRRITTNQNQSFWLKQFRSK